jgi:hypothetical protein
MSDATAIVLNANVTMLETPLAMSDANGARLKRNVAMLEATLIA